MSDTGVYIELNAYFRAGGWVNLCGYQHLLYQSLTGFIKLKNERNSTFIYIRFVNINSIFRYIFPLVGICYVSMVSILAGANTHTYSISECLQSNRVFRIV